jgi:uncharacterized membrane protein
VDRTRETHRLEHWVHRSLLAGLTLSSLLLVVGLTLALTRSQRRPEGPPPPVVALARGAAAGNGADVMALGLLALMATPVVRVAVLGLGWGLERAWRFLGVAAAVLGLLGLSLALGLGSGGPAGGGLVPGLVPIGGDEPRPGGQHHRPEGGRLGPGRYAPQRHHGGQLPEGFPDSQAVKLPLGQDQGAAGADGRGAGVADEACRVAERFGILRPAVIGLADVDLCQAVPVEPRDDHPEGLERSVPVPGRDHHLGRGGRPGASSSRETGRV